MLGLNRVTDWESQLQKVINNHNGREIVNDCFKTFKAKLIKRGNSGQHSFIHPALLLYNMYGDI